MGIRYRKSINLGGGFRVNISKSGVGYSWGVKGARITKTSKGTTRTTLSLPGTGISYVEETKNPNSVNSNKQYSNTTAKNSTEIINVNDYQSVEYQDLLNSIKKFQNFNLLSTVLFFSFVFYAKPIFIVTGVVGVILKIYTYMNLKVNIIYEFDTESQNSYENLNSIWVSMNQSNQFWQTISESNINRKTSGGASRGVARIPAIAIRKTPYFIKSNIIPFGLKLRKQCLYFFPDKLMVVSGRKVGAINYSDLTIRLNYINFVETGVVPKDAKIISYTWLKVNKNGSPDKRFKHNRKVPICKYGSVTIDSNSGLHVELMCSNSEIIERMRPYATQVFTVR